MATKPRVLCVDDEPGVLEGLALTLRRGFEVLTAESGKAGLEALANDSTIAVVISDMRMPGMSGAAFLARARTTTPDVIRLLLTGHAEVDAAIAAINEGQIFRFMTKPCPPHTLLAAVEAAVEQHRLVTSERVLLEQTLRGCIQMLMEVLALADPVAFGQVTRIQRYAAELASKVPGAQIWSIEVAAMLSQLGYISLAPETLDKLRRGKPLTPEEDAAAARLPQLAEQFMAGIPRLDLVRAALTHRTTPFAGGPGPSGPRGKDIPLGARVLGVVCDFDWLEAGGLSTPLALETLRGRRDRYDHELLELFAAMLGSREREAEVLELPIRLVRAEMVFLEDVRMRTGTLLVARGQESTAGLVERFRNLPVGAVREPVRVVLKKRGPPAE